MWGNLFSLIVLVVLDLLWKMGCGKDYVVVIFFGFGLVIEMFLFKWCWVGDGV